MKNQYTHLDYELTGRYHYDNQPFWDFNLKRDWFQIVAITAMVVFCGIIYLVAFN